MLKKINKKINKKIQITDLDNTLHSFLFLLEEYEFTNDQNAEMGFLSQLRKIADILQEVDFNGGFYLECKDQKIQNKLDHQIDFLFDTLKKAYTKIFDAIASLERINDQINDIEETYEIKDE